MGEWDIPQKIQTVGGWGHTFLETPRIFRFVTLSLYPSYSRQCYYTWIYKMAKSGSGTKISDENWQQNDKKKR